MGKKEAERESTGLAGGWLWGDLSGFGTPEFPAQTTGSLLFQVRPSPRGTEPQVCTPLGPGEARGAAHRAGGQSSDSALGVHAHVSKSLRLWLEAGRVRGMWTGPLLDPCPGFHTYGGEPAGQTSLLLGKAVIVKVFSCLKTSTCRWQLDAKDQNAEDRSWQEIEIWKLLAKRWKKAPHTDGVMEKARCSAGLSSGVPRCVLSRGELGEKILPLEYTCYRNRRQD